MISFSAIGSAGDAANYHDKAFSKDGIKAADNYYLNEQAAAHWEGRGAELLGLEGKPVTREDFVNFLEGRIPHPESGQIQDIGERARANGVERRPGVDFTVSPPKSVSIVALVGQDDRVVQAHQAANTRALAWLQEHGAVIRVREGGHSPKPEQAGNLLYATVLHETNRSNEPQLHNHNVIVAAVYDEQRGTWRSLTNDALFLLRAKADVVYKTELAKGLRAAGYELVYEKNGVDFEIKGLSRDQIETYSSRSEQIDEALKIRGIDPDNASYEARQAATVDSRSAKQEISREELHAKWGELARGVGLNLTEIVANARSRAAEIAALWDPAKELAGEQVRAHRAVSWAVEHLAEREQTFKFTDAAIEALKLDRTLTIDPVQAAIKRQMSEGAVLGKGLGKDGSRQLTTPKARHAEFSLARSIDQAKGRGNVVLKSHDEFTAAVARFEARKTTETGTAYRLSAEQVTAARNILMHPDGYQGIQGAAGTGKTAALEMVKEVAESKGWQVLGMATSASAAKELERSSGIKSQTVAAFFAQRDRSLKLAGAQIAKLEATIAEERKTGTPAGQLVENRRLKVAGHDGESVNVRYTFDHRQGEVFRSGTGLLNLLGSFLMESAQNQRDLGAAIQSPAPTLGERFKRGVKALQIGATDFLGQSLSSMEKVGTAEAVEARLALNLQSGPDRNTAARTLALRRAELKNIHVTGNKQGKKTLLVMDEASLTGASDAANIASVADRIGARVVDQGDTKQHGSVGAGRAFWQSQRAGMHTSVLTETRRFDNASQSVKDALEAMKVNQFSQAYGHLPTMGVKPKELSGAIAERFMNNWREVKNQGITEPQIGVVALTNRDRRSFNAAIHQALANAGIVSREAFEKPHFNNVDLTQAQQHFASAIEAAGATHLVFRRGYRDLQIHRNDAVKIIGFDADNNRILVETPSGKQVTVNPMKQESFSAFELQDRNYSVKDRVEARAIIRSGNRKMPDVSNGSRGYIEAIDATGTTVKWDDGSKSRLTDAQVRVIDHSYARTTYKEQGATNHREIIGVSETGAKIFNREAAYVAATRAKQNTEVVTSDKKTMLENADKDVSKTTAVTASKLRSAINARHPEVVQIQQSSKQIGKQQTHKMVR